MSQPFSCRSCGGTDLQPVLSLGAMPLANALLTEAQLGAEEETFPLDLVCCRRCSLAQITETVPPEKLFRDYLYFSSYSDTLLAHARTLAGRLTAERHLDGSSLVIEVASNDGYLLQYYAASGVPVLGIEPAENVAEVARRERHIPTRAEFFGPGLAEQLRREGLVADVVHAHNVLAHVADTRGFVAGLGRILKDAGVAIVEVPYVKDVLDGRAFDTIYHEHLCYFSLTALVHLFRSNGLAIVRVEHVPVQGGSLRLFASLPGAAPEEDCVGRMLEDEARWGVAAGGVYDAFAAGAQGIKASLSGLLRDLRASGQSVAAYGAAAKATVLLNYIRPEPGEVAFVVDRSPHKQGRYVPGVRIPVFPPERLLEEMPSHVLLLAWNLADEILAQQAEYRRRGGQFIVPIPEIAFA